jgi:hypothetical protein
MTQFASPANGQCTSQSDHCAWVEKSLERMLAIQAGMTRNQLMKIFTPEGGLSTAKERRFVSRDCGYFKVDVKFRRAAMKSQADEGESKWLVELDDDVIASISGPFLGYMIFD